jgi:hypothetical protein
MASNPKYIEIHIAPVMQKARISPAISLFSKWDLPKIHVGYYLYIVAEQFTSLRRLLLLSYNDPPFYCKQCFLYPSVSPEDYLIKSRGNHNELVNWSLIQVVEMGYFSRVRRWSIHNNCDEVQSDMRFPYPWSLLSLVSDRSFTLSQHGFHSFKLLVVLELEGALLLKFQPELVELIHSTRRRAIVSDWLGNNSNPMNLYN